MLYTCTKPRKEAEMKDPQTQDEKDSSVLEDLKKKIGRKIAEAYRTELKNNTDTSNKT
jgi:hypothetical protein